MNSSYAMIDVGCLDIMRQSSSSMVSSSPFTYLTYMMIDIPDELVGSYTYGYVNVSFHPPRVTSYTKLSSTLFLSYSWLMMMIIVMMIAIRIAMMMIIGYVYDIDYDGYYHLHASLLRVRSSSNSSWLIIYKQLYE